MTGKLISNFMVALPFFDFIGSIGTSHLPGVAHYLLAITAFLLFLAFSGRKRAIVHTK